MKTRSFTVIYFITHGIIPVAANYLAVVLIELYYHTFLFWHRDLSQAELALRYGPAPLILETALPFIVAAAAIIWYNLPVYIAVLRGGGREWPGRAKRRLLNSPLTYGIVSLGGWLISFGVNSLTYVFMEIPIQGDAVLISFIGVILGGFLCMTITYYFVEIVNRRYFVPRVFPDGILSPYRGVFRVSVRLRFLVFFISTSLLPGFLLILLVYSMRAYPSAVAAVGTHAIVVLAGILLAGGLLLTFMIARYFEEPLLDLAAAARRI